VVSVNLRHERHPRRAPHERVEERRRAVALAHYYRQAARLSIGQIADRLGRSPSTVKGYYFYGPTGAKASAVKAARYQGACRGCGALHPGAQRQGRRLRVLQGVPPRRDRASLDARTSARGDARLAGPLRRLAVVV
jgi:hypothetical protein